MKYCYSLILFTLSFLSLPTFADYGNSDQYPETNCPSKVYTLYIGGIPQTPAFDKMNTAYVKAIAASQKYPNLTVSVEGGEINCSTAWRAVSSSSRSSSSVSSSLSSSSATSPISSSSTSSDIDFWVSKTGSDSNPCTYGQPCLTIQKGISKLSAGKTLFVKAGTYLENSATNPSTARCGWFDPVTASICINQSGTVAAPITISAAPGEPVIIDSQGVRAGLQLNANDYITIKNLTFRNSYSVGIANWGQVENEVASIPELAVGITVEGNTFLNTYGPEGDNVSSIAMWGSKDWIVRNNVIDGVDAGGSTVASGIQSYGVINAIVENNTIRNVGFGIFWKDHFVKNAITRELWQESEIRYNRITATDAGVRISIRGGNTVEAGHNQIHHNIIDGLGGDGAGIVIAMSGAAGISGNLDILHNVIDCNSASGLVGLTIDSSKNTKITGNIFMSCAVPVESIKYSDINVTQITASNYNVFIDEFAIFMDRYSSTSKVYRELSDWRLARNTDAVSLNMDYPDLNSLHTSQSVLSGYRPPANSPVLGLMPNGSAAGAYQYGNETIGSF